MATETPNRQFGDGAIEQVDSKYDFHQLEEQVLDFWKMRDCFGKLVEQNSDKPLFRFIDGPITANNSMGVHHAWGRSIKDMFLRYKSMGGHRCIFQNGFDCQGLWVEVEVERELGFRGKPDILEYGLQAFSEACRERVNTYSSIITDQSIRLGQWMDWDNSYYTHDDSNIEGIWHFLKKCYENNWLYKGGVVMPWCPRCGTSLSEHEMSGSYVDTEHRSVFVKIELKERDSDILVWTTTPWTLTANVALAVNPELDYVEVAMEGEERTVILSQKAMGVLRAPGCKIVSTFKGTDLVGLHYEPIFPEIPIQEGVDHLIVPWDAVDAVEGTGVVHIAPGCGREDFDLGTEHGLAVLSPVNEEAVFVQGCGWLEGKNVLDSAEPIVERLKKDGKLLRDYMHEHSYPVCWRCKNEIIFRLVEEWFISSEEIRPRMMKAAAAVQWQPEFIGLRMQDWLKNMGDWCISRKRFWGLPLPFYDCQSCGNLTVVGSKKELSELSDDDVDGITELHRPWIDAVEINCPKCGAKAPRVVEVGDCWLDAGIVPYATTGYFDDIETWKTLYPAEWISEMREQVRLWFYSMLFVGVTLHDRAPYERVLAYERVVGEDGTTFSKTGYMINFDDAVDTVGADVIRYLFAAANVANDVRFGYGLGEMAKRRLLVFWNVYAFYANYARLDQPDLSAVSGIPVGLTESDRWLLSLTYNFVSESTGFMDEYDTASVVRLFDDFVTEMSNWYVRTNRRRFWKDGSSEDKTACYWTLYQTLKALTQVMAPIIPFMTESIWQNVVRPTEPNSPISVHLSEWPKLDEELGNAEILEQMENARTVVSLALRLRKEAGLKVRQPLATLYVVAEQPVKDSLTDLVELVQEEVNVRAIEWLDSDESLTVPSLILDPQKAGPVLRDSLPKVRSLMETLSPEQMSALVDDYGSQDGLRLPGWEEVLPKELFSLLEKPKANVSFGEEDGIFVALDTLPTQTLVREGWIREILRQSQVLRRDAGLQMDQRIHLAISTSSEEIRSAVSEWEELVTEETLAVDLAESLDSPLLVKEVEVGPGSVRLELTAA